jgi:flagellar basal body-associated protein FliL
MNETKKLHLAIGDLVDVESQDSNGETTGNFADNDTKRGLGVAIWMVQHQAWDQSVVTFEQDDTVYEVYVTPVFSEDINGVRVVFQVKLEYTVDNINQVTEIVSYDEIMKTSIDTKLFG